MQGRSTMSEFARTAQIISLIIAVTFCHGASSDAHPGGFAAAIEAYGDETAGDQVTPENKSESNLEPSSLSQLATLTPAQTGRSDELTQK